MTEIDRLRKELAKAKRTIETLATVLREARWPDVHLTHAILDNSDAVLMDVHKTLEETAG